MGSVYDRIPQILRENGPMTAKQLQIALFGEYNRNLRSTVNAKLRGYEKFRMVKIVGEVPANPGNMEWVWAVVE